MLIYGQVVAYFESKRQAYRYVAMCDVLGFGDLVLTSSLQDVVARYQRLLLTAHALRRRASSIFAMPSEDTASVSATIFSDTLVLTSAELNPARTVLDLGPVSEFFDTVSFVLQASVVTQLPLRAGIAFGGALLTGVPRSSSGDRLSRRTEQKATRSGSVVPATRRAKSLRTLTGFCHRNG